MKRLAEDKRINVTNLGLMAVVLHTGNVTLTVFIKRAFNQPVTSWLTGFVAQSQVFFICMPQKAATHTQFLWLHANNGIAASKRGELDPLNHNTVLLDQNSCTSEIHLTHFVRMLA